MYIYVVTEAAEIHIAKIILYILVGKKERQPIQKHI